jgi:hypothetical protein
VKRWRFVLLAVLVYVGLDLCLPVMPGAFVFDPDDSIESVNSGRLRLTGKLIVLPRITASPELPRQRLSSLVKRLPSGDQVLPRAHLVTRQLPRATCRSSSPSEDSH